MKVANAATAITAADFAGRWSGTYHSFGAARAKCDGGPCMLTLDISQCEKGWCGFLVKSDGTCGPAAMTVEVEKGKENFLRFNGRLEFDPKAASYAVQATLWASDGGVKSLDIIGDTGKELVLMRRSFPFSAHLARSGEAVCTASKATS